MMTLHKQQTSKRKRTREDVFVDSLIYFITFIILVLVLYPLVYVLSASISEPRLVTTGKLILLPKQITFEGYEKILEYKPIWIGYRNTIFYTTVGTLINIFGTVTCAYVLSRKDFRHIHVHNVFQRRTDSNLSGCKTDWDIKYRLVHVASGCYISIQRNDLQNLF